MERFESHYATYFDTPQPTWIVTLEEVRLCVVIVDPDGEVYRMLDQLDENEDLPELLEEDTLTFEIPYSAIEKAEFDRRPGYPVEVYWRDGKKREKNDLDFESDEMRARFFDVLEARLGGGDTIREVIPFSKARLFYDLLKYAGVITLATSPFFIVGYLDIQEAAAEPLSEDAGLFGTVGWYLGRNMAILFGLFMWGFCVSVILLFAVHELRNPSTIETLQPRDCKN